MKREKMCMIIESFFRTVVCVYKFFLKNKY